MADWVQTQYVLQRIKENNISVGCVLPTCWLYAYRGNLPIKADCLYRRVRLLAGGICLLDGGGGRLPASWHCGKADFLWAEWLTHACEHITFPQLRLWEVKTNKNAYQHCVSRYLKLRRWFFLFLPFWMRWRSEFSWNPIGGGGGVGDGYVFGCIFFGKFLNFFFLPSTPIPTAHPPPQSKMAVGVGVRGGYGWGWGEVGVYLDSFLEFLERVWRVWEGEDCLHTHRHITD